MCQKKLLLLGCESLPEKDALDLLRKILGESRIDRELDAAVRITELVGRLPLALQVIGGTLRGKPRSLEAVCRFLTS